MMMIIGSALFFWHVCMIVSNCESPIVVVLSGSMEPAYYRGDILFVSHVRQRVETGDVIVF
jgi:signal peptidase